MNRFTHVKEAKYCRAMNILDEIEDEELKKEYLEAITMPSISPADIEAGMRKEGYPVSHMTIYRHRIGQCICPK